MWTKQLKETAMELANNKSLSLSNSNASNLSYDQKLALATTYGAADPKQEEEKSDPYWA